MSKFLDVARDVIVHLAKEFGYWARSRWQKASPRGRKIALAALALAALTAALWDSLDHVGHWWEFQRGRRPFTEAKSWHYNLDKLDIDRLAKTTDDVLVIDFARNEGKTPLTADEIKRLKTRSDGRRRCIRRPLQLRESLCRKACGQGRDAHRGRGRTQNGSWIHPETSPFHFQFRAWHSLSS